MKKKSLVKNSEKINTPFSLFSEVDQDFIERPQTIEEVEFITEDLTPEEEEQFEIQRQFNLKQKEIHELHMIETEGNVEILSDEEKDYLDTSKLKRIKMPPSNKGKRRAVEQYLSVKLGSDGRRLTDRLIEQALYIYDSEVDGINPRYTDETVRFSQKALLDFGFYKPTLKQEKTVDVSIEHKLDDALQAIHDNRERIKLLK